MTEELQVLRTLWDALKKADEIVENHHKDYWDSDRIPVHIVNAWREADDNLTTAKHSVEEFYRLQKKCSDCPGVTKPNRKRCSKCHNARKNRNRIRSRPEGAHRAEHVGRWEMLSSE